MPDAPTAYPLQWPPGRPRTPNRIEGRFTSTRESGHGWKQHLPVTATDARKRLQRELDALGARLAILSSNVELRLDGLPRTGRLNPTDPGVAVYFQLNGKPVVLACDRFTAVEQNIAAVAGHIEATRRIDRYGVGTTAQMFEGFLALPRPMVVNDWRGPLDDPRSLADAEATYRRKMLTAHPDCGGSEAAAATLNVAITEARKALT